ncbi:MAG: hydroxymethylbilane synthase [Chitinophagaceae bacterium]
MKTLIRIGTRESQLATWQASLVQQLFSEQGQEAVLVLIKSQGDIDLKTPLYEMGVQGIFTRSLDIALLENRCDIAVHSMKDVPTQLPLGIVQAAVLKRGPVNDLLVYKKDTEFLNSINDLANIATSSIRRKAQWLNRYPHHFIHNLRGNVNSRLRKLSVESWDAAIFAQAGLERINLRPEKSMVLEWMLPAPAQGAIVVVCRKGDDSIFESCSRFNDLNTELCTKTERDFQHALAGGCSKPISALAEIKAGKLHFRGNIFSTDGQQKACIEKETAINDTDELGSRAALELLQNGGKEIADHIEHAAQ